MVVDPGDGANGIKKGMRVASELSRACGHCWNCRNGLPNYCRSMNDALLPGGFSEGNPGVKYAGIQFYQSCSGYH